MKLAEPPRTLDNRTALPEIAKRAYNRLFAWRYGVPPRSAGAAPSIPVEWGGLPLNIGDLETGLFMCVENIDGWLDSPPLDGNDVARAVADGSAWGPKTLGARAIAVTGVCLGPRDQTRAARDALGSLAAARVPMDFTVADPDLDTSLTASTRADSDALKLAPLGDQGFRYQVTLTAADPLLYGDWQQVILAPGSGAATGRIYGKDYPWEYGAGQIPTSGILENEGNVDAPAIALYQGDLASPDLVDDNGSAIYLTDIGAGMEVQVDTARLQAIAAGGLSRASYIMPNSVPMLIPAQSQIGWHLGSASASGSGQVVVVWRSAWA
jgi:hypothetical protein